VPRSADAQGSAATGKIASLQGAYFSDPADIRGDRFRPPRLEAPTGQLNPPNDVPTL